MASGGSETEIVSKQMSTGQKRFYFNLKQNDRGRFLKVRGILAARAGLLAGDCLAA